MENVQRYQVWSCLDRSLTSVAIATDAPAAAKADLFAHRSPYIRPLYRRRNCYLLRSWFCQIIAATTTTETAPATNAATDVVWLLLVLLRYDCRVAEYTFRCIVTYLPPSFNFSLQSLFSVLLLFLRAAFGPLISLSVHSFICPISSVRGCRC